MRDLRATHGWEAGRIAECVRGRRGSLRASIHSRPLQPHYAAASTFGAWKITPRLCAPSLCIRAHVSFCRSTPHDRTCVVGTHLILLSICRTCIQVQFDVSALQSAPHLDDLFLHRERKELESGAPAALGEGAFAGTRLVRRFRPMDEHERGGRGLNRWRRKPSASEIDDRKFRKSRFREDPLSTGASNIMTNHLTGGPPVSSTHIAGLVCALNNKSSDSRAAILSSCAPFWTAPLGKTVQNSPPR